MSRYELQKSADGHHFSLLSTLLPTTNNGSAITYMADDLTPFSGINYYRVKAVYSSGYEKYSAIVSLSSQAGASAFSIYPNPVEAHVLSIRTGHIQPGNYSVQLFSANGQCVYSNRISVSNSNEVKMLQLNNTIPTGIYRLLLSGSNSTPVVVSVLLK